MSQSFANGNLNNSNNFSSPALSPSLLPTLGGSLIAPSGLSPGRPFKNKHNISLFNKRNIRWC